MERRRKDKINKWILKLAQAVPQCKWGKQVRNTVNLGRLDYFYVTSPLRLCPSEHTLRHRLDLTGASHFLQTKVEWMLSVVDKIWAGNLYEHLHWGPEGKPLLTPIETGHEYFIVLVKWNNRRHLYQKLMKTNLLSRALYQKLIQLVHNSSNPVDLYWGLTLMNY